MTANINPIPLDPNIFKKLAGENISALKLVYLFDKNTVKTADRSAFNTSKSVGVTKSVGILGLDVEIIQFGELIDSFFTFPKNDPLFIGPNGAVTNTPPLTGFSTTIGHSMGSGGIYIDIQEPIKLF